MFSLNSNRSLANHNPHLHHRGFNHLRALLEHSLEDGWAQFCHHCHCHCYEFKTRGVIKNKDAIKTRGNLNRTRGNLDRTRGNLDRIRGNLNRTRDTINMITSRTSLKL